VKADSILLHYADIRTFEILLRTYEVRDGALNSASTNEEATVGPRPQKRKKFTPSGENADCIQKTSSVLVRPCSTAKGHTGYLTFARLRV
jgi:tRNA (adenine57-N1/adenine58-N1)-methyltransferase catalytic subunit